MLRLAVLVLAGAFVAGCAEPCTEFPTRASLDFAWDGTEAELVEAMRALGWSPGEDEPGRLPQLTLGDVVARVDVQGPAGARIEAEGPTRGETSLDAARAELEPAMAPLAERFSAAPTYLAGSLHCGAV